MAVLVLLLPLFAVGVARADELQFSGGTIQFVGTTGGVDFTINNGTVVSSNPGGDAAIGSTISFGTSQRLAFFSSAANGTGRFSHLHWTSRSRGQWGIDVGGNSSSWVR